MTWREKKQLAFLDREVVTLKDFWRWLKRAEAFTRSLPDKCVAANEPTNTHNTTSLHRLAERLYEHVLNLDLPVEKTDRCATRYHQDKWDVIGNILWLRK